MTVEKLLIPKITISFSTFPMSWTSEERNLHFWKSICSTFPWRKPTWFSEESSSLNCLKFRLSAKNPIWTKIRIAAVKKSLPGFHLFRTRCRWKKIRSKSYPNARTSHQKSLSNFKKSVKMKKDFLGWVEKERWDFSISSKF